MSEKVKKGLKKLGVITGMTFLILLGLLLACVIYLFVYPKGSIFGVRYHRYKSTHFYSSEVVSVEDINGVNISADEYDVKVDVSEKVEEIRVYITNDIAGYYRASKSLVEPEVVFNPETKVWEISTNSVKGLELRNESAIRVVVPVGFCDKDFDISVKVKKDSNVDIVGNSKFDVSVGLLDLTVQRGDVFIDDISVDRAKIKATRSKIVAGRGLKGEIRELTLDIGNSKLNFLNAGNAETEFGKENPDYNAVNFNIQKTIIVSARKSAKISILKCGVVVSAPGVKLNNGKLELLWLNNFMDINSKGFDVEIGYIKNDGDGLEYNSYSLFSSSGNGSVFISKTDAICSIKTNTGDINIINSTNALILESKTGNINVEEATKNVSVVNAGGKVNLKFSKLIDLGSEDGVRQVDLLRVAGSKVVVEGVNNIKIDAKNNSDITVRFNSVEGENVFNIDDSDLGVIVPDGGDLRLLVKGNDSFVGIDVGGYKREKSKLILGTIIDEIVYSDLSVNVLDISATKGEIEILSDNLV